MVYLKTYFYTGFEFKYLSLNLLEAYDYIDKFIIIEYNRTHTGDYREFIWEKYKHLLPQDKMDKVQYFACNMDHVMVKTDDENIMHSVNESHMRGHFVKLMDFQDEDIIFSVDADEIIYGEQYPEIIKYVEKHSECRLHMHQFFYKYSYLWGNNPFVAPTVSKYRVHKYNYPDNWRYSGNVFPHVCGCHFSWCMSVDDMIYKLNTYAHAPQYAKFADKTILENAVKNKVYPFDPTTRFEITELKLEEYEQYHPKKMREAFYNEDY